MLNSAWKGVLSHMEESCSLYDWVKHIVNSYLEPQNLNIPNISSQRSSKDFEMFLLGMSNFEDFEKKCLECRLQNNDSKSVVCPLLIPFAVNTNKSNPRIRAQSGTFVAYPVNHFGRVKFFDLNKVQDVLLETGCISKPFMYKTVLKGSDLWELAQSLKLSGVRKFRYMPDIPFS